MRFLFFIFSCISLYNATAHDITDLENSSTTEKLQEDISNTEIPQQAVHSPKHYESLLKNCVELITTKKFNEAFDSINAILQVKKQHEYADITDQAVLCLALLRIKEKRHHDAKELLIDLAQTVKNEHVISYINYLLANIYTEENNFNIAIDYIKKISIYDDVEKSLIISTLKKILEKAPENTLNEILKSENLEKEIKDYTTKVKYYCDKVKIYAETAEKNRLNNFLDSANIDLIKNSKNEEERKYKIAVFINNENSHTKEHNSNHLNSFLLFQNSFTSDIEVNFIFFNKGPNLISTQNALNRLDKENVDVIVVLEDAPSRSNNLISDYAREKSIPIFNFFDDYFIDDNPFYRIIRPCQLTIVNRLAFFLKKESATNKKVVVITLQDNYSDYTISTFKKISESYDLCKTTAFEFTNSELSDLLNYYIKKSKRKNSTTNDRYKEIEEADYIIILNNSEFLVNSIISLLSTIKKKPKVIFMAEALNCKSVSIDQIIELESYIVSEVDLMNLSNYNAEILMKIHDQLKVSVQKEDMIIYKGLDIIFKSLQKYGKNFLFGLSYNSVGLSSACNPNFSYGTFRDPQDVYVYKITKKSKSDYELIAVN